MMRNTSQDLRCVHRSMHGWGNDSNGLGRSGDYDAMHVYSAPVIRRALNVNVKSIAQADWFDADPNTDTNSLPSKGSMMPARGFPQFRHWNE
jgi:hypothetical protein